MHEPGEMMISGDRGDGRTPEALASELLAFEREITARRPARVRLEDSSDSCLAAALVAAKLLVPLEASAAATDPATVNGRLIAQLVQIHSPG